MLRGAEAREDDRNSSANGLGSIEHGLGRQEQPLGWTAKLTPVGCLPRGDRRTKKEDHDCSTLRDVSCTYPTPRWSSAPLDASIRLYHPSFRRAWRRLTQDSENSQDRSQSLKVSALGSGPMKVSLIIVADHGYKYSAVHKVTRNCSRAVCLSFFHHLMITSIYCAALVALSLILPFSSAASTGRERRATTCNGFAQVCVSHASMSLLGIYQVNSFAIRVMEISLLSVPTTLMQLGSTMVRFHVVWH